MNYLKFEELYFSLNKIGKDNCSFYEHLLAELKIVKIQLIMKNEIKSRLL